MSARQPRKKRRLEPEGRSSSEPPELIQPDQVEKSFKESDREMHPRREDSPILEKGTFETAAELYRGRSRLWSYKVNDSDTSDSEVNQPARTSKRSRKSDSIVADFKTENKRLRFPNSSEARSTRSHKSATADSASGSGNKISDYFVPVAGAKPKKKRSSVTVDSAPGTSGSQNKTLTSEHGEGRTSASKNQAFFEKIRNCYGLFGDDSSKEYDENKPNYFEKLPVHIMETIFCQIPMLDLLKCRLVSKTWNEVISGPKFMDWKILYYRIKMKNPRALAQIKSITIKLGLNTVEDAFKVFIRYMAEEYLRKPSDDMYKLLSRNEEAVKAELVLKERFPQFCNKDSTPWSIFAMAVLLSETIWDIFDLYESLTVHYSYCSVHDLTNALYCAAAFLLYFRNTLHLNYGLHYRVYYVLYLIENNLPSKDVIGTQALKVPKGLPGQQSIHSFCDSSNSHLTYEQLRILNHCIQPKQTIKIVALAGTGKTTTLVHLSQLYPQVRFLNVMYNKAMCEDAKRRFPANVTCKTAHSLAYAIYGSRLRYKLSTKVKPHDIVTLLQHKEKTKLHVYSYAKHVLSTIESYVCSSDEEISMDHVPILDGNSKGISEEDKLKLLKDTKLIWARMIDREDKTVKITHDVYLKLYQLSKPNLSQYQCIMVDEAQDCNPAMLSVMLSQKLPVILVGDPNQQIYGFRGAKNALQSIDATHTYRLTKSFRFGPEIAYVASSCLESLKHNTTETLVGNEKNSYVNGTVQGQYAIIARSNVSLFNEAVRIVCHKRVRDNEPSNINAAFVGGISGYGFGQLLDMCKLANFHTDADYVIKDKFISKFKSYEDLTNYAKNADDADLQSKVELIKLHTVEIPNYIKTIKDKCSHPLQLANVVFSTAHKAKGLEFDTVCLTDDYPIVNWSNLRRRGCINQGSEEEEYNIIYVALTRAKTCLLMPEKLHRVFLSTNEKFEYPVLSRSLLKDDEDEIKCVICCESFTPHTVLALERRDIMLSNGRRIEGGGLCMKCRTDPKVRTRLEMEPVIMYLDPTDDYAHRSMGSLVGPLPGDPPIVHNTFPPFQDMDVVYIVNIHM